MRLRNQLRFLAVLIGPLSCAGVESLDPPAAGAECGPEGCLRGDATLDAGALEASGGFEIDAKSPEISPVNPFCGNIACDPDDFEPTECLDAGAGDAEYGENQEASALTDGGTFTSDAPSNAPSNAPGAGGDNAGNMAGSMGGPKSPSAPNDADEPIPPQDPPSDDASSVACQVTSDEKKKPVSKCVPAGTGKDSSPCVTSADCGAGYACVGENAGVCRKYCCLDAESCPTVSNGGTRDTYCGLRPSRDPTGFMLPVCIPANPCDLLPGLEGKNGCDEGLMCAIVRSDGTTACVGPGEAREGEPCEVVGAGKSPCAEGFVCSKATNTCLALCIVDAPDACDGAECQGGTNGIPDNYGVCVGARD